MKFQCLMSRLVAMFVILVAACAWPQNTNSVDELAKEPEEKSHTAGD